MTSTRDLLLAVQSGKSTVIQATFDAVITEKTTAAIEAYREAVIDNTFNEVSESELDEVAYDSRTLDDKKKKQPVIARGVKGMKSTPFEKKFPSMAHYEKWADSEASGNHEVHDVRLHESTEEELEEDADESEEVSELSKKTLSSYVKKASVTAVTGKEASTAQASEMGRHLDKGDVKGATHFAKKANDLNTKVIKRVTGIAKAADKLAKE